MIRQQHLIPFLFLWFASVFAVHFLPAAEPCHSGLQPGQRPGPYSAIISTGPERGKSHCYICETGDRPAVVVFARSLGDGLGKLCQELDRAVAEHKKGELKAWVTFLNDNQLSFDPKVVRWGKKYALRTIPLGVFEDVAGPPSYRLAQDADITILLFVKQEVTASFAFRPGELTKDNLRKVLKALPAIVGEKGKETTATKGP
jgi:hypothetical protein